ncbi:hypothetical protein [Clostridium arbusti]|uniref:hypothetical protein n=1 Tax=Clostridium arbusti TaxID=1137848 RepID=UPI0002888801|nr:hypothetical protein [Clostridium arbusti]
MKKIKNIIDFIKEELIKEEVKKLNNKSKGKYLNQNMKTAIVTGLSMSVLFAYTAYGVDTSQLDTIIQWIAQWSGRIGLAVAFFGGLQTALGFKSEDADARTRGLKTLAAGFMVFGISNSLSLFGL